MSALHAHYQCSTLMKDLALDDVAKHEISWKDDKFPSNSWKQHFLERELAYVRQAEAASTYADRHSLLDLGY